MANAIYEGYDGDKLILTINVNTGEMHIYDYGTVTIPPLFERATLGYAVVA